MGVYSSLAAISQTTTHMHRHHEAAMGLAGVSLGIGALAHRRSRQATKAQVREGDNQVTTGRDLTPKYPTLVATTRTPTRVPITQ